MTKASHTQITTMPAIAELVLHAAPMLLIDRVCDAGPDHLRAEITIQQTSMFFEKDHGVPAYVGIEYIAQAVAAYGGWRAKSADPAAAPRIGYLLGTRKMTMTRDWFEPGTRLNIYVENVFEDGEMGVFKGEIRDGNDVIVAAQINVFQPGDTDATLATSHTTHNQETTTP
ncbi:3-hydroxydecanoyl-ACP dehydratase [Thalassospira lohafexi]|uniref:3-hydroxydecanoyl-ACP dehydratase n=1 Tax=Thalassospira lohafexi TaxID=744227 RepID=A0A2N3L4X7_9PROT|nr:3-hydroxydecanoyl-ACP dehydratase [Thalassospira lohafexi]PKR57740.1 3-hydroxydecanoyl-ACP dehydratase [Thalassospira lohafexi]